MCASSQANKICEQACGLVAKYTVPTPASPFTSDSESEVEASSTASSPEEAEVQDDQEADQAEEQTLVQLPDDIFVTSQPYPASSQVYAPPSFSSVSAAMAPGSSFMAPCSQAHHLLSQPGSRFYGMDIGASNDLWSSHCLMSF
jgi:hypothetical protein